MSHDTFSHNTRNQLKQVFDALRELMTPPDPPKRPIGFVTDDEKKTKNSRRASVPPEAPRTRRASSQLPSGKYWHASCLQTKSAISLADLISSKCSKNVGSSIERK